MLSSDALPACLPGGSVDVMDGERRHVLVTKHPERFINIEGARTVLQNVSCEART